MKEKSVIIIGAGPAGSMCAYLLSKIGWQVLVLERNIFPLRNKICGEYLCPAGCDLLDKSGLGSILVNYPVIDGMNLYSPNLQTVNTHFPHNKIGRALNRNKFDNDLIELAKSSGAIFLFGTQATSFYLKNKTINVSDGKNSWQSDYLIGADGRQSLVGKWIGLRQQNNNKRVAIHSYLMSRSNIIASQAEMHIFEDNTYCGLNPVSLNHWNISIICDAKNIKKNTANEFAKRIILNSPRLTELFNLEDQKIVWKIAAGITNPMKKVGSLEHRSFLIGDAAGFIDPLTGEGIYHALLTAEKLVQAIHHDEINLNKYQKSIQSNFKDKEILNYFFQWLIKHPTLCNLVARFLKINPVIGDTFIGLIGNIYNPAKALRIIIKNLLSKKREIPHVDHRMR